MSDNNASDWTALENLHDSHLPRRRVPHFSCADTVSRNDTAVLESARVAHEAIGSSCHPEEMACLYWKAGAGTVSSATQTWVGAEAQQTIPKTLLLELRIMM